MGEASTYVDACRVPRVIAQPQSGHRYVLRV